MFVNGNLEATDSTSVKIVSVAAIVFFSPAAVRRNKFSCPTRINKEYIFIISDWFWWAQAGHGDGNVADFFLNDKKIDIRGEAGKTCFGM